VSIIGVLPSLSLFQKNLIESGLEMPGSDKLLLRVSESAPMAAAIPV
jgi:hypothetical protein